MLGACRLKSTAVLALHSCYVRLKQPRRITYAVLLLLLLLRTMLQAGQRHRRGLVQL